MSHRAHIYMTYSFFTEIWGPGCAPHHGLRAAVFSGKLPPNRLHVEV